jgi:hypothetical protein
VVLFGPLTFVAAVAVADVAAHLRTTSLRPGLLLDLRAVQEVDASGVDAVHGMVALARRYRAAVALLGVRADVRDALIAGDPVGDIEACFAASAADAATPLQSDGGALRLTLDVGHRGDELAKDRPDLLQQLSAAQRPHSGGPVAEREAQGGLRIYAWSYDVGRAEVLEWNEARGEFIPVRGRPAS